MKTDANTRTRNLEIQSGPGGSDPHRIVDTDDILVSQVWLIPLLFVVARNSVQHTRRN